MEGSGQFTITFEASEVTAESKEFGEPQEIAGERFQVHLNLVKDDLRVYLFLVDSHKTLYHGCFESVCSLVGADKEKKVVLEILSMHSPFFAEAFKSSEEIRIAVEDQIFPIEVLLYFLYGIEVDLSLLSTDIIAKLLLLIDRYQCSILKSTVERKLLEIDEAKCLQKYLTEIDQCGMKHLARQVVNAYTGHDLKELQKKAKIANSFSASTTNAIINRSPIITTSIMKLLVFLALLGIASAAVHQMQLRGVQVPRNEPKSAILAKIGQQVNAFKDMYYVGNITVGTPAQNFTVLLDTGSAFFWVTDSSCGAQVQCPSYCTDGTLWGGQCEQYCAAQCCDGSSTYTDPKSSCAKKHRFDSSKSSSYKKNGQSWDITYATGEAKGVLGQDTVAFGGPGAKQLAVRNMVFGQASSTDSSQSKTPFDGILGLGLTSSIEGTVSPLIQAIRQRLFDEPIFTVYLERKGDVDNVEGGVITWGGIDSQNCGSDIHYAPLVGRGAWQFQLDGVSLGSYSNKKSIPALSDTGSGAIFGPKDAVDGIAKALKAVRVGTNYVLPCEGNPDLVFTIGGKKFAVKSENYVASVGARIVQGVKYCFLGILGRDGADHWTLGSPFIRQFCQIYDVQRTRIGIVAPKA
ncbi:hypothetical protein QR680_011127 [Steinernema hermaphroditum]|uniref:Peptidase A1 domain-containing protein n=1 Tax=Steinernema hermaphroditum TaxID=289476 RepID=A0AA39IR89_9BILA|nr:hypothetical protein QR680_011127 [Steinernema hermaphroditum]